MKKMDEVPDLKAKSSNTDTPPKAHSVISVEIKKTSECKQDELANGESVSNRKLRNRDGSFIKTVKKEARRLEQGMSPAGSTTSQRKKMKKGIFISYSPDAGFMERRFVVETVKQLKENNLAEDIWFDKDERNTDNPCWFSFRMEAVERCRAAMLFLSDSYFSCPVSIYEGKALLERLKDDSTSVKVFLILYSLSPETEIPKPYQHLLQDMVDLTTPKIGHLSLAEKTSIVIGALMVELEKFASILVSGAPTPAPDTEFTGEYKNKKICQWGPNDLQEWLFNLGIREFYRQSLAENMVDGFLLMSTTDQDMINHLGIDSRVVRKKIMQQILVTLDKEHKLADNWHLRARTQRPRPNCIYLVYDPTDVRLAQNLKQDLIKKGLQVIHHHKLGQSKEEFLQLNGPQMALATFVLIIMTEGAANSPFVFHEIIFADWLGKKLITGVFKNTWTSLRPAMKAVLGDCPSVDFETKLYIESLDVLEHHIKPLRTVPGVVLEQAYLNKMADGLKPFAMLSSLNTGQSEPASADIHGQREPQIFISFQWDNQSRVDDIRQMLETNGLMCWVDIDPTMTTKRGSGGITNMRGGQVGGEMNNESLQCCIQRNMKAAGLILCCVTPKYLQSDNCLKDLSLAESLHKPIIPVLLRFSQWPPDSAPPLVRKILVKHMPIDLSNEKLYKQNVPVLLDKTKKLLNFK